jgi:hypothetical protein
MQADQSGATEAARKGADPHRLMDGEDPSTQSAQTAHQWLKAYAELLELQADLLDMIAERMPSMCGEARHEAEETNLPVIVTQMERFRFRLEFWRQRKQELGGSDGNPDDPPARVGGPDLGP